MTTLAPPSGLDQPGAHIPACLSPQQTTSDLLISSNYCLVLLGLRRSRILRGQREGQVAPALPGWRHLGRLEGGCVSVCLAGSMWNHLLSHMLWQLGLTVNQNPTYGLFTSSLCTSWLGLPHSLVAEFPETGAQVQYCGSPCVFLLQPGAVTWCPFYRVSWLQEVKTVVTQACSHTRGSRLLQSLAPSLAVLWLLGHQKGEFLALSASGQKFA